MPCEVCSGVPTSARPRTARALTPFFTRLLATALLFGARDGAAQTTSSTVVKSFWPELDVYVRTGAHTRLYGIATFQFAEDTTLNSGQYGINLDLFVKHPQLFKVRPAVDALAFDRTQPVMLRVGIRYQGNLATPEDPEDQIKIPIELTGRWTTRYWSLSDRNGFDFRWINGEYSTRYRNRIYFELTPVQKGYLVVPYGDIEWFYSIQQGEWTSVRYEAGLHLPVVSHLAVEPYAAWQSYWHVSSPNQRGLGFNVVLTW